MPTKTVSSQRAGQARSSSTKPTKLTTGQSEEVSQVAYQLWLEGGCQHGRDQEDWAKAEAIVRRQS